MTSTLLLTSLCLLTSLSSAASPCVFALDDAVEHPAEELLRRQRDVDVADLLTRGYAFPTAPGTDPASCDGMAHALVIFRKSPAEVMALLSQTHRQDEYLPTLNRIESRLRSRNQSIDEHVLRVLFRKLVYRIHYRWSWEEAKIWWELDAGFENSVRELRGYWHLYPFEGGRTLGVYASHVDVGPIFPRSVQDAMTQKTIRQSLDHIRRWVESGGRYKP